MDTSAPPPPPQPKTTRRHPRFEMYASVELHAGDETVLLPARNISLGGVYLSADGHDVAAFVVGMELDVQVLDALDDSREPVRLVGEVVRHDGDGIALMWAESDPEAARALAELLDRLQPHETRFDVDERTGDDATASDERADDDGTASDDGITSDDGAASHGAASHDGTGGGDGTVSDDDSAA